MQNRVCTVCGEEKPISAFPKNGVDKDGSIRYRPDCKDCYGISRKISKKKHSKFVSSTKHRTGEINTLSLAEWKESVLFFKGCCAYCGKKQSRQVKLTKDHVVPVSAGGPTVKSNIIPACTSCNCSKGDKALDEWYRKQAYFRQERLQKILKWVKNHGD